jgi:hypothetical protein
MKSGQIIETEPKPTEVAEDKAHDQGVNHLVQVYNQGDASQYNSNPGQTQYPQQPSQGQTDSPQGQQEVYEVQDLAYLNGFYSGDGRGGKPHGQGTYTTNNLMCTGQFVDGRMEGKFTIEDFITGTEYQGDVVDGQLTGNCKYTFADGSIYEGQVENGRFHGDGQFTL